MGVSVNVTNNSKSSDSDNISATGTATLSFNGKQYSTSLAEPEGTYVKEAETNVTTGNITILASELSRGATFPGLTVKGTGGMLKTMVVEQLRWLFMVCCLSP